MKYLAWAVSGVPEFQLKLSIRPCQALTLKYLFWWRTPPKGAAVCRFHLAFCSAVGTVQGEECHCLPHTAAAQGLFRPVPVSGLGRARVWREGCLLFCVMGCHQGKRGKIELVENAASGVLSKLLCTTWDTSFAGALVNVEAWFLLFSETMRVLASPLLDLSTLLSCCLSP